MTVLLFNEFQRVTWTLAASILLGLTPPLFAQEYENTAVFEAIENVGLVPLGESAGSHGTLGLSLGAGASMHNLGNLTTQQKRQLGFTEVGSQELYMPRIWLTKGLPIPIDVGLSVGASQAPILQQGTGYVQLTIFEGFALPSLALRASQSRLFMARATSLTANQVGLAASWSFFKYLTVFGSSSQTWHEGETGLTEGGLPEALSLGEGSLVERDQTTTKRWEDRTASLGVQLKIAPPYISLTAEIVRRGDSRQAAMAKVSMGL